MAHRSAQVTISATAPTLIMTASRFPQLSGTLADPIPVVLQNIDATNIIYLGGPDVSAANGFPLAKAGGQLQVSIEARNSLYAIAAAGTPLLAVLASRQ